jgi:threonine aldolase
MSDSLRTDAAPDAEKARLVRHDPSVRGFASDNHAGVHPEVLEAIAAANGGHQSSYGQDAYTQRLQDVFRGHFGPEASAYCVFNGTGANVVALQSMTQRWEAVICAETAHINVDEGGAPETMAGLKLHAVPAPDGKLTPDLIATQAWGWGDEHRAQPRVVSLTQSTELGTCYTVQEIATITEQAHALGMLVHLDGARISNAAASLGLPFQAFTTDVGIDVVSFGGTKNGLLLGECIVVLSPTAVRGIEYLRKTSMQLASKMRFISAQFDALLSGDLWLRNARHANAMARRLEAAVNEISGAEVLYPVQANAVFAIIPRDVAARLREQYSFYIWNEQTGAVRWMTSFDTTETDIDSFVSSLRTEMPVG